MRELTPQEKLFVQNWINTRDEKEAAARAGVDKKVAARVGRSWLKDPDIRRSIDDEIDKSAHKTKLSRDWVMKQAEKLFHRCTGDVIPDGAKKMADMKNALGALQLIDKMLVKLEEGGDGDKPAATINITTNKDSLDFKIM